MIRPLQVGPSLLLTVAVAENELERTKLNAEHSESRRITRIHEKHVATTCFACRSVGHAARDCPNVLLASSGGGSADLLLPEHDKKGYKSDEAMKRRGGKKGGDVTGGKCYRYVGFEIEAHAESVQV